MFGRERSIHPGGQGLPSHDGGNPLDYVKSGTCPLQDQADDRLRSKEFF
jgi:hypothetical protein